MSMGGSKGMIKDNGSIAKIDNLNNLCFHRMGR